MGIPEELAKAQVTDLLAKTKVGLTGKVVVLNARGKQAGKVAVDGVVPVPPGTNLLPARDADGRAYVEEICKKGLALPPGAIGEMFYRTANASRDAPAARVFRFQYYGPWDWVIA